MLGAQRVRRGREKGRERRRGRKRGREVGMKKGRRKRQEGRNEGGVSETEASRASKHTAVLRCCQG